MAALKTRTFANVLLMDAFLRGAIVSGSQTKSPIYSLHGTKLVFTTPALTVTFSDPTFKGLTYKEVLAQIKSAIAVMNPRFVDQKLILELATPGSIVLNTQASQSTAAPFLGIATTAGASTLSTTVYAPPDGSAPRVVAFAPNNQMDGIIVMTEE